MTLEQAKSDLEKIGCKCIISENILGGFLVVSSESDLKDRSNEIEDVLSELGFGSLWDEECRMSLWRIDFVAAIQN